MTPSPAFRSAHQIREDVASGTTTARAVVEETFARIARLEPKVDAFLHLDKEGALRRADEIDRRVTAGDAAGRLLGVPVALKDNMCARGLPTTCGSRILEGYVAPYDSHVAERIAAEGGIVIGKTNLDEFAMGSSTENSAFKVTKNPHDVKRVPGGSSGGSAAAIAAGMVPLSLGSDTGGSIRQPAAFCGVVGFKPTYGLVSRYGLVAFASSLDQIGPFAGTVRDAARFTSVIAGHDPRDSTSLAQPATDYETTLARDLEGVRVGVHKDYVDDIADETVKARIHRGLDLLRDAGARIVRLDAIDLLSRLALPTYYLVAPSEASSNLARVDGMRYGPRETAADLNATLSATRGRRFGPEVTRRILLGTFALSAGYYDAYYQKALKVRRLIRDAFARAFEKVDLIAGGTSPVPAFEIGKNVDDPLTMYRCDVLTIPASLAGLPGISVPCGLESDALPTGLQIIGPPLRDAQVLAAAFAFEQRSGLAGRLAPMAEAAS